MTQAILSLTGNRNDVAIHLREIYSWVESTNYLTGDGRTVNKNWAHGHYAAYRASVQSVCQTMVDKGVLARPRRGFYQLVKAGTKLPRLAIATALPNVKVAKTSLTGTIWQKILSANAQVKQPSAKMSPSRRVDRFKRLRDDLAECYSWSCQICGGDATFKIPLKESGCYYVEVHHVDVLADSFESLSEDNWDGFKVNGVENLVVLCPYHHAVIHRHYPTYKFDRSGLLWRNDQGDLLRLSFLLTQHVY